MRRFLLCALLAAAGLVASCDLYSPTPGKRYALVYGVSIYVTSQGEGVYPNLTHTDEDAGSIRDLFSAKGYDVSRYRIQSDATKANILADIASIPSDAEEVFFYFSGHGAKDLGIQYICPFGSVPFDVPYMISTATLSAAMKALPCTAKTVVLDTCYSGGFVAPGPASDPTPPDYGTGHTPAYPLYLYPLTFEPSIGDTTVYISAAGRDEESWENDYLGHGVFTYFFLEAAASGDANGDGLLSVLELYWYARRNVDSFWNFSPYITSINYFLPHISGSALDYILFTAG